jgi:hypothetical protein
MGKPLPHGRSPTESIGRRGEPGELKHLSSRRKGHQFETPLVVASERGLGQWPDVSYQNRLERRAVAGDSPVWDGEHQALE